MKSTLFLPLILYSACLGVLAGIGALWGQRNTGSAEVQRLRGELRSKEASLRGGREANRDLRERERILSDTLPSLGRSAEVTWGPEPPQAPLPPPGQTQAPREREERLRMERERLEESRRVYNERIRRNADRSIAYAQTRFTFFEAEMEREAPPEIREERERILSLIATYAELRDMEADPAYSEEERREFYRMRLGLPVEIQQRMDRQRIHLLEETARELGYGGGDLDAVVSSLELMVRNTSHRGFRSPHPGETPPGWRLDDILQREAP